METKSLIILSLAGIITACGGSDSSSGVNSLVSGVEETSDTSETFNGIWVASTDGTIELNDLEISASGNINLSSLEVFTIFEGEGNTFRVYYCDDREFEDDYDEFTVVGNQATLTNGDAGREIDLTIIRNTRLEGTLTFNQVSFDTEIDASAITEWTKVAPLPGTFSEYMENGFKIGDVQFSFLEAGSNSAQTGDSDVICFDLSRSNGRYEFQGETFTFENEQEIEITLDTGNFDILTLESSTDDPQGFEEVYYSGANGFFDNYETPEAVVSVSSGFPLTIDVNATDFDGTDFEAQVDIDFSSVTVAE